MVFKKKTNAREREREKINERRVIIHSNDFLSRFGLFFIFSCLSLIFGGC